MSSCFVLRLEDIVAYKVSTSTSSRTRAIEKFLIYNKSAHMPSDIKTIHLEQTSYYLPGEIDFPVPSPNLFLHIGPLKLYLDTPTILWINAFYLNLQKCLMSLKLGTTETIHHCKESDMKGQPTKIILTAATDIWSIYLDPFWAEFTVCESGRTRLQPFIDPLPITLWFYSSQKPEDVLRTVLNKGEPDNFKMCLPNLQSYGCQNNNMANVEVDTSYSNSGNLNNNEDENEADVYLLIHVNSLVNVQLSHFQYLFVLRAADIITDMMENLEIDTSTIIKNKPVLSVCTSVWVPQIEISLVLRNLNQMSATSDSVDLASLQEDCSSTSDIPQNFQSKILQSKSSLSVGEYDPPNKKTNHDTLCSGILDDCCIENGLPKSCSDSLLNCHSSGSSQGVNTPVQEAQPSIATESIQRGFQTGTSAMKRGLCSLVASIDSAFVKSEAFSSMDGDTPSFPDDDTVSIRSDVSSDMDQFVLVNQDGSLEDEFFQHARPEIGVDVASKMRENSIISNYTLNSEKKKEMVSITVFKFGKVGFVSHSKLNTNMLLHCGQIETKEEAAISWENFQNNFSTRARSWKNEKMITSLRECEFSMRIDKDYICGIDGSKPQPGPGFMSILASNLYLQLQMNSISGLVEFFEDELVSKPMPSKIILDNLQIQLQEEQPPSGLLSPNSAPLNISLPGCIIERTIDGTLSVLPLPHGYVEKNIGDLLNHTSSSEIFSRSQNIHNSNSCSNGESPGLSICDNSEDEQLSLVKLVQDNKELRSKLNLMKNLEQENQILRQELNLLRNSVEDERLKQLLESRCEIRRLEHEKTTLQETLRLLQNEVNRLETEKQQVNRYH
ncbi:UHRF1-binding protein 1-like [Caerostris darwini]|uniref:UHRF1-binding protein 1-like n=1 Tax=Caerostris darwini TaxID=1538125 RepID=A0AAV4V655_9ARAC|nr:UHRF1-binding protein 1-like [Caerostris darwini]